MVAHLFSPPVLIHAHIFFSHERIHVLIDCHLTQHISQPHTLAHAVKPPAGPVPMNKRWPPPCYPIYSPAHQFTHPSILSIHLFIYPPIHIQRPTHPFIKHFIDSFIHLFNYPPINPFVHVCRNVRRHEVHDAFRRWRHDDVYAYVLSRMNYTPDSHNHLSLTYESWSI